MLSRRLFFKLGTVAAAGSWARSFPAQDNAQARCAPLPPSITNLKSLAHQATPITRDEREERQEKARQLMVANGIDALLLTEGTSLTYFTGLRWSGSERMFAIVLPAKKRWFCVCPAFEEARAREQLMQSPEGDNADVRTWQEDESPYQRIMEGLKDRGLSASTLGIEETVRFVFSHEVAKAAPQTKIVSATAVTAGCRMIKSNHEIELMRLAAKVTLAAYQAAYRALSEGMTQHEFSWLVEAAHSQFGFQGSADVQVGPASALPHGSIAPQVIREGTILLMDGGCRVEGYTSDISRTFVLGKPTSRMQQVFEIVHRAQSTALKTARPGIRCGDIDAAARKVISEAGYGPAYKYFTHRVGHGMGMDGHEWPYLVQGNPTVMVPHMVFSDEPGIYIAEQFGVRLEDDMHITENGAELFTPQSPSLEDPFGTA